MCRQIDRGIDSSLYVIVIILHKSFAVIIFIYSSMYDFVFMSMVFIYLCVLCNSIINYVIYIYDTILTKY